MSEFRLLPRLEHRSGSARRSELLAGKKPSFDPDALVEAMASAKAFPATGGTRVTESEIIEFRQDCVRSVAMAATEVGAIAGFDLALGRQLAHFSTDSRGEMGVSSVWDFLTLIVLPDLVMERIGTVSSESSDGSVRSRLTGGDRRHVLQKLWKRRIVFGDEIVESRQLTEDDFVATLERRITLEHPKLAQRVARAIISSGYQGSARREYTRILMRRLVQLAGIVHLDDNDEAHLDQSVTQVHGEAVLALETRSTR